MKIQSTLFFSNEPLVTVWTTGSNVEIDEQYRHLLPKSYNVELKDKKMVITQNDPVSYIAFLYHGISGDYLRASEAEVVDLVDSEKNSLVSKQSDAGFSGTVATSSDAGVFTPTFGGDRKNKHKYRLEKDWVHEHDGFPEHPISVTLGGQEMAKDESTLQLFKDWLRREGVDEKNKKFLQEYGFPLPVEEDELYDDTNINANPQPWVVNESGEEYDAEDREDLEEEENDKYAWTE